MFQLLECSRCFHAGVYPSGGPLCGPWGRSRADEPKSVGWMMFMCAVRLDAVNYRIAGYFDDKTTQRGRCL